jgi:hypothetical protein
VGGSFFALSGYGDPVEIEDRPKRGRITEFSKRSRRRMMTGLAMINRDKAGVPSFVGLTYPDECLPVSERDVKRHLAAFRAAYVRRYGKKAVLWRREYQTRKSGAFVGEQVPHVHLLVWDSSLPTVWCRDRDGRWFLAAAEAERAWLAETWCRIVGAPEETRAKHEAVTRHPKSWLLPDSWRGTLAYVSKYVAKVNEVECEGRSWGYWWRELLPIELLSDEIPHETFHAMRRVLRRYVERQTGRQFPVRAKWSGLTVFLSEATGAALVRWAWIGKGVT